MSPSERRRVYVSGHRNPDADSIAAAIGYAELCGRLDPTQEYVPVRLGAVNAQTRWLLERSGARTPRLLAHVRLRVRDVMRTEFPIAARKDPVRGVGLTMAACGLDLVPIVDGRGILSGVITERALARRYIRESREASRLDAPTRVSAIVDVLEGELLCGEDQELKGRVWVVAMDTASRSSVAPGDIVVVGDRTDAQLRALEMGASLLVCSNSTTPPAAVLERAMQLGAAVVRSELDSYVTSRMITLSEPCSALIEGDPLTVGADDLVRDISSQIKDVHYRAAVAVDGGGRPVGLVTRSDLVNPAPRRVVLVDHAERAQSVPGVEEAEIVEILDHHHIGSIETKLPVRATFDPVGSTATLVIERFHQAGQQPTEASAAMLLGALLSDTVLLSSPTSTERDRTACASIEQQLGIDAIAYGREMYAGSSDVSGVPAAELVLRDLKEYELEGGRTLAVAQIETVGDGIADRREELQQAVAAERERRGNVLFALMLTDILARDTTLLFAGPDQVAERAFDARPHNGAIELPGVMSRKKQVAPQLLAAAAAGG